MQYFFTTKCVFFRMLLDTWTRNICGQKLCSCRPFLWNCWDLHSKMLNFCTSVTNVPRPTSEFGSPLPVQPHASAVTWDQVGTQLTQANCRSRIQRFNYNCCTLGYSCNSGGGPSLVHEARLPTWQAVLLICTFNIRKSTLDSKLCQGISAFCA